MPDTRGTKCDTCVNCIYDQVTAQLKCLMQQLEFASPDANKCEWWDDEEETVMRVPCYDCAYNEDKKCQKGMVVFKTRRAKDCSEFSKDGTFPLMKLENKHKETKPKVKCVANNEISVLFYMD